MIQELNGNLSPADAVDSLPRCRFCDAKLSYTFVDLGMSPLCESFLTVAQISQAESFYPLLAYVCDQCFLVQLGQYVPAERIFSEYAYFSSFSDTWLNHAKTYVRMIVNRLNLGRDSQVVEVASNDGYLLQYFVDSGIPALGIEPAANVAAAAVNKGVRSIVKYFGVETASELAAAGYKADLLIGNNVLAQVPDLADFIGGIEILLKPSGIFTLEFPHLMMLIKENQYDTIYHEHFSYFSFSTVERIFTTCRLTVFDVEELPTHGGSLRIYGCHPGRQPLTDRVKNLKVREERAGLARLDGYLSFSEQVKRSKRALLQCLIEAKREGKTIVGYGAPGKGNTLLNYCGIRTDFLDYTVDRNPYKHGKYTPGTHIPVFPPEKIDQTKPDLILILPWNIRDEITAQLAYARNWGARFIIPIPEVSVL